MSRIYKVAGYVKLAKLWERSRDEAITLNKAYYQEKKLDIPEMELVDVYIDITGQKKICKRPEMLRLVNDVQLGKIDCIAVQTKGYIAANTLEFCFLLQMLWELNPLVELVTEDLEYRINTINNVDGQREALKKMANHFVALDPPVYHEWKRNVFEGIRKYVCEDGADQ